MMDIRWIAISAFLLGIVVIAWRFRKASFNRTDGLAGESIRLELTPKRVSAFLRGEERMFRPVVRLTQRRLLIGQLPLFGKNPNIRYSLHLDTLSGPVENRPLSTGFVSFLLKPEQLTWEADHLKIETSDHGGLSGIPARIEIHLQPEDLAQLQSAIQSLRL